MHAWRIAIIWIISKPLVLNGQSSWQEKIVWNKQVPKSNIQNLRSAFARIVNDVAYPEAAWFAADAPLERREQKGHQKGVNEFRLETSSDQI